METSFKVRYKETDKMGIVYHSNYFVWFDIGRTEFLRELGYDYRRMEEENILLPVIDVGCKYIKPARYDDEVTVKTKIEKLKGTKLEFKYEVFINKEKISEGYTIHGFVDKDLKPLKFKSERKDLWEILNKNTKEGDK